MEFKSKCNIKFNENDRVWNEDETCYCRCGEKLKYVGTYDGGLDYQRIGYSDKEYKDLSTYTDQPHEEIREGFEWGNRFDKERNLLPRTVYIKLKDIDDNHLSTIINMLNGCNENGKIMKVFLNESEYRSLRRDYERRK